MKIRKGQMVMYGKISYFNANKGYGFIVGEDGCDYFFHVNDIEGYSGTLPVKGEAVCFGDSVETAKGKAAKHVILSGKGDETNDNK